MIHLRWMLVLLFAGCVARPLVGVKGEPPEPPMCPGVGFECSAFDELPAPVPIDDSVFDETLVDCQTMLPTVEDCDRILSGAHVEGLAVRGCTSAGPIQIPDTMILTGVDLGCTHCPLSWQRGRPSKCVTPCFAAQRSLLAVGQGSNFRIVGSTGDNLAIHSEGQSWVELIEGSVFTNVHLDAGPRVEGRAILIADSEMFDLALRTGSRASAHLQRSAIFSGTLIPAELVADETQLTDVKLKADRALITAGSLTGSIAQLESGSFVTTAVVKSTLEECGRLHLFETRFAESHLAACVEPVEFVGGDVDISTLAGRLDITATRIRQSGFASGPHELLLNSASVEVSMFCGETHIESSGSSLVCVACDPQIDSANLVSSIVRAPECPSLEVIAQALED